MHPNEDDGDEPLSDEDSQEQEMDEKEEHDEHHPSAKSDSVGQEMVTKVDFFITRKYARSTYENCKNVLMSTTNGPAMDILCGPWGSYRCSGMYDSTVVYLWIE